MAKKDSTQSPSSAIDMCDELHTIAARLAGIEDVIRRVYDDSDSQIGNILHLVADLTADANERICLVADRVHGLREAPKGGV